MEKVKPVVIALWSKVFSVSGLQRGVIFHSITGIPSLKSTAVLQKWSGIACFRLNRGVGKLGPFFFEDIAMPGNGANRMSIRPLLRMTSTEALFSSKLAILIYCCTYRMGICTDFSPPWYLCIKAIIAHLHDAKKYRSRRRKLSIRQSCYFSTRIKVWGTVSIYQPYLLSMYINGIRNFYYACSWLITKKCVTIESPWDLGLWGISLFD